MFTPSGLVFFSTAALNPFTLQNRSVLTAKREFPTLFPTVLLVWMVHKGLLSALKQSRVTLASAC